jgi:23S rRNA pseudouridine2605 synthase
MTEKIQKVLARAGLASRRTIEQWITAGRITVNGKLAKLGDRIALDAQIKVDGKPIKGNVLCIRS